MTTLVLAMVIVLVTYLIGFITRVGLFYIAGMVVAMFVGAWTFSNGVVVQSVVYVVGTGFVQNTVDANIFVALFGVLIMFGLMFIAYEKNYRA